jgi:regulator of protease activity HflC (stomatin/prohibitin superfamily)
MSRGQGWLWLWAAAALTSGVGCSSEDIPPGNKGFLFDRTGALAFYTGGSGLVTDEVLLSGTHYTGFYDEIRDVNCKDTETRESAEVLTASDLTVKVDLRLTYSANCDTPASLEKILQQVATNDGDDTVEPEALYARYILPIIREALRNRLAAVNIERVKEVREDLRIGIREDLEKSILKEGHPVHVRILTVSDIQLPNEIVEKNREIELARQDAEAEREKQAAARFRLERELFEAQQERKVRVEEAERLRDVARIEAEKDKEVVILKAEGDLEARKREAEGIEAIRAQIDDRYLRYLSVLKDAEVRERMAEAMSQGTKWYVGPEFLIPPDSSGTVSVGR